jgi:hypothetical protein
MPGTSTGGDTGRDDDAQGDERRDELGNEHRPEHSAEPLPAEPLPDADVDTRWAELVSQLGDLEVPPAAPEVTAPDRVVARSAGPRDRPTTPEVEALEDAESHFVPPDPGPVVTGRDPLVTLAWVVVVAVPVLTLLAVVLRPAVPALHLPGWTGAVAAAAFACAVGVLVWRMPTHRDPDDRDDGAVV